MKSKIKLSAISNFVGDVKADPDSVIERKQFAQEIRMVEGEDRTIIAKISTNQVDRDGDILIPRGCDTSDFASNSVVMWNHSYSQPPIGKVTALQITDDAIIAKMTFAETEFGNEIWSLVKGGFLNCCSIGFLATAALIKGTSAFMAYVKENDLGDITNCKRIITAFTLFENSMVPLPANAGALIQQISAKSITISDDLQKQLQLSKAVTPEKEHGDKEDMKIANDLEEPKKPVDPFGPDDKAPVPPEDEPAVEPVPEDPDKEADAGAKEEEVEEAVEEIPVITDAPADDEPAADEPAPEAPAEPTPEAPEAPVEEPAVPAEAPEETPEATPAPEDEPTVDPEESPVPEAEPEAPVPEEEEKVEEPAPEAEEAPAEPEAPADEWVVVREGPYQASEDDSEKAMALKAGKIL
jgi:phage head maturation protease